MYIYEILLYLIILAQIGVGWLFIRYLIQRDRGPKEPKKLLILTGLLVIPSAALGLFLEYKFLPNTLLDNPHSLKTGQLLHSALLIGLIEEGVKSLPLALLIYRSKFFNEVTDGLIYFGISGMVFGVLEDIEYAITMGPGAGIGKITSGPWIHAGLCIIFGYALASKKMQRRGWWLPLLGFAIAASLHGLYDFGLMLGRGWSLLMSISITIFVNGMILVFYRLAEKSDVALGLSSAGPNYYCRNCGQPNPQRFLYCTDCGQKA